LDNQNENHHSVFSAAINSYIGTCHAVSNLFQHNVFLLNLVLFTAVARYR